MKDKSMPAISITPEQVSDYIAQAGRDAWIVPDVPADTQRRKIQKVAKWSKTPPVAFQRVPTETSLCDFMAPKVKAL